ncbi:MAG TPA: anti-sigma factor [Solirubrobacteraceae bacterium]|nr:anti-sigma factor [Solirubrobacteraceae bacterium]
MNSENHLPAHEGCGADTAAYALGALEPAEAEAFERHLEGCVICAEELAGFQRTTDMLAPSAPQYAVPSGLRARVVGGVRAEPRRSGAADKRRGRAWRLIAPGGGRALAALATAVAVALAAAVIVIRPRLSGGPGGARVISASVVDSAGSARVRLSGGRAELIIRGFPQPPAGLIYEVWLKRPGRVPAPTRVLFSVTGHGAGDIGVPAPLNGVSKILVTSEPDGGSDVPTHPAVIVAPLS